MSDVETEIREMLQRRADDVDVSGTIPGPTLRRSRRRRVVNAVSVLATTVAVIVGAVVGVTAVRRDPQNIPYVEQPIRPKQRTVVSVGGAPQEVVTGLGAVWVERQDQVVRIDPATNRVVARIVAAGQPRAHRSGATFQRRYYFGTRGFTVSAGTGGLSGPALREDSVWATGTGFTESSEPVSPTETPTTTPDPQTAYAWSLLRIDPATNTWVATMPAETGVITGSLPSAIVAGGGAVWAAGEGASFEDGAVHRIDMDTEEATTIRMEGPVTGIALLDGFVWAAVDVNRKDARGLVKIDPRTNRVVQTVLLPGAIVLQGLAAGDGSLWVPTIFEKDGVAVVRIDAASGRIAARVQVRGPVTGIALGASGVWVSVQDDEHLFRIDPAYDEVAGRLQVGGVPEGSMAVDGTQLWVVADPDGGGDPKAPFLVRFDL